jgi:hypothetical protein
MALRRSPFEVLAMSCSVSAEGRVFVSGKAKGMIRLRALIMKVGAIDKKLEIASRRQTCENSFDASCFTHSTTLTAGCAIKSFPTTDLTSHSPSPPRSIQLVSALPAEPVSETMITRGQLPEVYD